MLLHLPELLAEGGGTARGEVEAALRYVLTLECDAQGVRGERRAGAGGGLGPAERHGDRPQPWLMASEGWGIWGWRVRSGRLQALGGEENAVPVL